MCAAPASASTFSGRAYSRSIRSRTCRSRARSRSRCSSAGRAATSARLGVPGQGVQLEVEQLARAIERLAVPGGEDRVRATSGVLVRPYLPGAGEQERDVGVRVGKADAAEVAWGDEPAREGGLGVDADVR